VAVRLPATHDGGDSVPTSMAVAIGYPFNGEHTLGAIGRTVNHCGYDRCAQDQMARAGRARGATDR